MKALSEALISRKNISNAIAHTTLYCIANYDDDLDLVGDDIVTVRSKDWVTIHILSEESVHRRSKEINDMICDIWRVKDPKLSIEDVRKKISSNTWRKDLDRRLCEHVHFYTVKEALIGKKNSKNASIGTGKDLYLVDPYNEYYDYLHDMYLEYEFSQSAVFIIDKDVIREMIKTVGRSGRMSRHISVYPLSGFSKKMLSEFENDLQDTDNINDGILDAYGLVKIDIYDLL